jgi:hypothetical protein
MPFREMFQANTVYPNNIYTSCELTVLWEKVFSKFIKSDINLMQSIGYIRQIQMKFKFALRYWRYLINMKCDLNRYRTFGNKTRRRNFTLCVYFIWTRSVLRIPSWIWGNGLLETVGNHVYDNTESQPGKRQTNFVRIINMHHNEKTTRKWFLYFFWKYLEHYIWTPSLCGGLWVSKSSTSTWAQHQFLRIQKVQPMWRAPCFNLRNQETLMQTVIDAYSSPQNSQSGTAYPTCVLPHLAYSSGFDVSIIYWVLYRENCVCLTGISQSTTVI